jgi:hypothetical protein
MSEKSNIAGRLQRLQGEVETAKGDLFNAILSLSDNPRIKRLGDNCFVVSSEDLGGNWSVVHHDFHEQYRLIVDVLGNVKLHTILARLRAIVEEEVLDRNYRIRLHRDVIKNLKGLMGDDNGSD